MVTSLAIGAGACFTIVSIQTATQLVDSPVVKQHDVLADLLAVVTTCVGVTLPSCLVLQIATRIKRIALTGSTFTRASTTFSKRDYLVPAVFVLALLFLVERRVPVTIYPFATVGAAVAFVAIGLLQTRRTTISFSIGAVAVGVLLIQSSAFWDWNARKPFLRDLNKIRVGMSFEEVKRTMRRHLDRPTEADPAPDMEKTTRLSTVRATRRHITLIGVL